MGGANESVVPQPKSQPSSSGGEEVSQVAGQTIRIHESRGEVHFHVDAENLRCAIPVSSWFAMWHRLKSRQAKKETFVDSSGVRLRARSFINDRDQMEFFIEIDQYVTGVGPMFTALQKVSHA